MKLIKEPDEVKEYYPDVCSGFPNRGKGEVPVLEEEVLETVDE